MSFQAYMRAFSLDSDSYSGGLGWGFRPKKKGSKPKAKKYNNWWESYTVDQLKQLCKACKLKVSGSKPELVKRLCEEGEPTRAYEQATVGYLKDLCSQKLLAKSGNKFDLVLRLLQVHHGTADGTLKRAATETQVVVDKATCTGETKEIQVVKKRKVLPSPKTFYNRVEKKVNAVSQKKYQSHWGSKSHGPAVVSLMDDLLGQVEPFLESDPGFSLELITSIFMGLLDNWQTMERPGYICDGWSFMMTKLKRYLDVLMPRMSQDDKQHMAEWMMELSDEISGYCLDDAYGKDDNKATLAGLANLLLERPASEEKPKENQPITLQMTSNVAGAPTEYTVMDPKGSGILNDIRSGGLGVIS